MSTNGSERAGVATDLRDDVLVQRTLALARAHECRVGPPGPRFRRGVIVQQQLSLEIVDHAHHLEKRAKWLLCFGRIQKKQASQTPHQEGGNGGADHEARNDVGPVVAVFGDAIESREEGQTQQGQGQDGLGQAAAFHPHRARHVHLEAGEEAGTLWVFGFAFHLFFFFPPYTGLFYF